MADSAQNTEVNIETEELQTESPNQEPTRFQGYATRDGERLPASVPSVPLADKGDKAVKEAATEDDKAAAPADENADDSGEDGDEGQRHKSAQQRINKAVGKQRAAERRAAAAEQQLATMNARLTALEGGKSPAPSSGKPAGDKEPNPADYDHGELDVRYIRDLTRFEVKQELAQSEQSKTQQQKQTEMTAQQEQFVAAKDDFMTRGLDIADDFEEIVTDDSVGISPVLVDLAFESDLGPQIIYAAASDPKEAKKLSAMSPARQAAWFGIKEAELSSGSSDAEDNGDETLPANQSSTMATQAPAPMKAKPKGNGKAQPATADTNDFQAFERMAMNQQ